MPEAFDVFYCFLHQLTWTAYYLQGEQEDGSLLFAVDLHGAISREGRDLTAQLAAGACLTQICRAEHEYLQSEKNTVLYNSCLEEARQNGSMAILTHILERAVKVGFPCIAFSQMICAFHTAAIPL